MKRIAILLSAVLVLQACGDKKGNPNEEIAKLKKERADLDVRLRKLEAETVDTTKRKSIPVSVMDVQPALFNAFIEVQSQVLGDENVNATPQMMGTIRTVSVRPGQSVSRGQVLATMDASALDQQIAAQQVQITLAKTVYEKQQNLWKQNIGTEVQLLQAKANYEAATKGVAAIQAQRNMYRIVAPISGVVDEVNVKVGDASGPGQPMGIRIVNKTKLKAQARLGEAYLGKVQAGNPVTLVFPDLQDSIQTRVGYVAQSVDPMSRAFLVEVPLGSNAKLRPNMSCRMKIANYESKSAIAIPVNAIQKTADGDVVYIAEGTTARAAKVTTGRSSNGLVEITAGLSAGDKVIIEGYQDLDEGVAISVQ